MIVVFVGPTLPAVDAAAELDAIYASPATQGDVYRAVRSGATAIGLIDGHFDSVPSVWHKEILWALSEGIPIYGSASMGALRAAELWPYGMIGIGDIYESYRDGRLSDDDEVALSHLLAEHDYRRISEPLVDIRATVHCAVRSTVIDDATAEALVAAGKALFYPDRNYAAIISAAHPSAPADQLAAFGAWWPTNRVSVKRADAMLMLRAMAHDLALGSTPEHTHFWFERTALWDDLAREAEDWRGRDASPIGLAKDRALAMASGTTRAARDLALARILARDLARHHNFQLDEDLLATAIARFREQRSLWTFDDLELWMKRNQLDRAGFLRIAADEARLDWVREVLSHEVDAMMADHLRSSGEFEPKGR